MSNYKVRVMLKILIVLVNFFGLIAYLLIVKL